MKTHEVTTAGLLAEHLRARLPSLPVMVQVGDVIAPIDEMRVDRGAVVLSAAAPKKTKSLRVSGKSSAKPKAEK